MWWRVYSRIGVRVAPEGAYSAGWRRHEALLELEAKWQSGGVRFWSLDSHFAAPVGDSLVPVFEIDDDALFVADSC